jgi:uncharacterized membrane protein YphA (DoxX/SURF4 family)
MKMNEPIGDAAYGPLFLRCTLGSYFVLAGMLKLENMEAFLKIIESISLIPKPLAMVIGVITPYLEVASGVMLIVGFCTTLAGLIMSLLLAIFVYLFGIYPKGSSELFNKDIILLASSVSLLFTGAGALSLDKFRKG